MENDELTEILMTYAGRFYAAKRNGDVEQGKAENARVHAEIEALYAKKDAARFERALGANRPPTETISYDKGWNDRGAEARTRYYGGDGNASSK